MIALNGAVVFANSAPQLNPATAAIPVDKEWLNGDIVVIAYQVTTSQSFPITSITNTGSGLSAWALMTDGVTAAKFLTGTGAECEVWFATAGGDGFGTITVHRTSSNVVTQVSCFCLSGTAATPVKKVVSANYLTPVFNNRSYYAPASSATANTQALLIDGVGVLFDHAQAQPPTTSLVADNVYLSNPPSGRVQLAAFLQRGSNAAGATFSPPVDGASSLGTWITFTILLAATSATPSTATYQRQDRRLAEPSSQTIETITGANLTIYVTLPIAIVNQYSAMIPNVGPDTLVINYTDYQGQAALLTRKVTLWMSDSGYVFLSADQLTQFLVAGVNGPFFDTNAVNINNRNMAASAVTLLPAANPERYDAPKLLSNQVRPQVFIYDGQLMP